MKRKAEIKNLVLVLILPVLLLIWWQAAANSGSINTRLIPSPLMVIENFKEIILNGRLWKNLSVSFSRVVVGFLIGATLGLIFGFFMGLFKNVNLLLTLFVSVLRPIPTIALIPVFILILGIGESSKYAIIAIGSFWSVLLNTINGVDSVDSKLLEVGYAYRIS